MSKPEVAIATGRAISTMFTALRKQGVMSLLVMFDSNTDSLEVLCSETNDPQQVMVMAKQALEGLKCQDLPAVDGQPKVWTQ